VLAQFKPHDQINNLLDSTMANNAPPIAFLGYVERASHVRDGNTNLWKYNVLGLKQIVLSLLFPMSLTGGGLAFAIYDPEVGSHLGLKIRAASGADIGSLDLSFRPPEEATEKASEGSVLRKDGPMLMVPQGGWTFAVITSDTFRFLFPEPGQYNLFLKDGDTETLIGSLGLALVNAEPLTPARIAAIRSDPGGTKAVRTAAKCNKCNDGIKAYAGLERITELEAQGYVWYESVPESFQCSCGAFSFDLGTIRRNLHGLLGQKTTPAGEVGFLPLYEKGSLDTIRASLVALLRQIAPEETFQVFLEENPVLLHTLSPEQIYFKPPILSQRKADFAVVNAQRELILIELERPNTRILKKDGGVHSELQHAFDQARDWLHAADEHRLAVLECIGVERERVGAVKAVVIAGQDAGYDPDQLRKLKGTDFGRIRFLTYDDVLAGLDILIRSMTQM
jgi:hypothetical protein